MQNMDFDLIFRIVKFILLLCMSMYYSDKILKAINRYQNTKEKETDNAKIHLMMSIDPDMAEKEVDNMITKYFDDYITTEILAKNEVYIKKEQVKIIIRDVSKSIFINISELYLFYIKLLVNIENEDQLMNFIYKKVKLQTMEFYINFNKVKE